MMWIIFGACLFVWGLYILFSKDATQAMRGYPSKDEKSYCIDRYTPWSFNAGLILSGVILFSMGFIGVFESKDVLVPALICLVFAITFICAGTLLRFSDNFNVIYWKYVQKSYKYFNVDDEKMWSTLVSIGVMLLIAAYMLFVL